jgi:hypothetical protein
MKNFHLRDGISKLILLFEKPVFKLLPLNLTQLVWSGDTELLSSKGVDKLLLELQLIIRKLKIKNIQFRIKYNFFITKNLNALQFRK